MRVMERCVVAAKSGQAAEVESTVFVTLQVWSTAAVYQPPPQSHALCTQTHSTDSACDCAYVCVHVPEACPSDTL